jgi:cytochrome c-type biogenesis protein
LVDLLLAYGAGLLTLINPCVLPVLPIVLASSLQADRRGPLALAGGLSLSFVVLGLFVAVLGASIGLTPQVMSITAAWVMIVFGAVLLVPQLNQGFVAVTAGFASRADNRLRDMESAGRQTGLAGQFLGGIMLGAVWSPCIGPTLGGAISLASQGQQVAWSAAIMVFFALGVSTIVVALAFGTREVLLRRQQMLRQLAGRAKPVLGVTFLAVGLYILTGLDRWVEGQLLDLLPIWLQDLSVSI